MRKVIIESPYSGDVSRNITYARAVMRDCLDRGESPYASHLLYTQAGVLDDSSPEERKLGMEAAAEWMDVADAVVVYKDFGITDGMREGIARAESVGKPVEYRSLFYD